MCLYEHDCEVKHFSLGTDLDNERFRAILTSRFAASDQQSDSSLNKQKS